MYQRGIRTTAYAIIWNDKFKIKYTTLKNELDYFYFTILFDFACCISYATYSLILDYI